MPVVLCNWDSWTLPAVHPSEAAIKKWEYAYHRAIDPERVRKGTNATSAETALAAASYCESMRSNNSKVLKWFLKPAYMYVSDLKMSYRLEPWRLSASNVPETKCDIRLSSEVLLYCYSHLWGGATTRVNGRYQMPVGENFDRWRWYLHVGQMNNEGRSFDGEFLLTSAYRN
jgi:hypothetical protein